MTKDESDELYIDTYDSNVTISGSVPSVSEPTSTDFGRQRLETIIGILGAIILVVAMIGIFFYEGTVH